MFHQNLENQDFAMEEMPSPPPPLKNHGESRACLLSHRFGLAIPRIEMSPFLIHIATDWANQPIVHSEYFQSCLLKMVIPIVSSSPAIVFMASKASKGFEFQWLQSHLIHGLSPEIPQESFQMQSLVGAPVSGRTWCLEGVVRTTMNRWLAMGWPWSCLVNGLIMRYSASVVVYITSVNRCV